MLIGALNRAKRLLELLEQRTAALQSMEQDEESKVRLGKRQRI